MTCAIDCIVTTKNPDEKNYIIAENKVQRV